jgi:surfeit locus 1 family protein
VAAQPGRISRVAFAAAAGLFAFLFASLGIWQINRLAWKQDLVLRIEARVHAAPVAAPGPAEWPLVDAAGFEYRRVEVRGRYLDAPETLTKAVTDRGPGFWVLAPFRSDDGFTLLINRGFVPENRRGPDDRQRAVGAPSRVVGLLRMTEPGGGFLRANDPTADRWYSRDVEAVAVARGLGRIAPYFIDADAASEPGPLPLGGMTRIQFRNAHLVYALTWFSLALMSAAATIYLVRGSGQPDPDSH